MKYVRTTVVEAVQWTGDIRPILEFIPGAQPVFGPDGMVTVYNANGGWESDLYIGSYLTKDDGGFFMGFDQDMFENDYKELPDEPA